MLTTITWPLVINLWWGAPYDTHCRMMCKMIHYNVYNGVLHFHCNIVVSLLKSYSSNYYSCKPTEVQRQPRERWWSGLKPAGDSCRGCGREVNAFIKGSGALKQNKFERSVYPQSASLKLLHLPSQSFEVIRRVILRLSHHTQQDDHPVKCSIHHTDNNGYNHKRYPTQNNPTQMIGLIFRNILDQMPYRLLNIVSEIKS